MDPKLILLQIINDTQPLQQPHQLDRLFHSKVPYHISWWKILDELRNEGLIKNEVLTITDKGIEYLKEKYQQRKIGTLKVKNTFKLDIGIIISCEPVDGIAKVSSLAALRVDNQIVLWEVHGIKGWHSQTGELTIDLFFQKENYETSSLDILDIPIGQEIEIFKN
jgi:hypothetical protein